MRQIYLYLKYMIKTEKLMFIGYILCFYTWIGVFRNFTKYGSMILIFIGLFNYKRKKEIVDLEKTLPISSRGKSVAEVIYLFLALALALLFGKIMDFDTMQIIMLVWAFIFIIKIYNEKYDLKKKILTRMGK